MSDHLPTPMSVQKLQSALQAKAKTEPGCRFYSLWDKVWRPDVLLEAWKRCRANGGAPGTDGVSFANIESDGVESWLGKLREELKDKTYRPQPLLRVWIPKSNGGQRPLGIPTIKDRVVQMAVVLVIGPIFETDLQPEQFGFRPGRDAKLAVRLVYCQISQKGRQEIVDADLSDYFNTIPHGPLMKCLSRRITDGQVLKVIRRWLRCPIMEKDRRSTAENRDKQQKGRGTPQGGVISPLLANLYFRRFLLGWKKFGLDRKYNARIINYADDFVICCPRGRGAPATESMKRLMGKLGLRVNDEKTRLVSVPDGQVDFLGYTIGRLYGRDGKAYIGSRPSRKSVRRLLEEIHAQTSKRWYPTEPETRIAMINQKLRGWAGYFNQGSILKCYWHVQHYTENRVRRWFMRRSQRKGIGYSRYPAAYLHGELGLLSLPTSRKDLLQAKGLRDEMRAGCGKTASPVRRAGTGNGTMDRTEAPTLW